MLAAEEAASSSTASPSTTVTLGSSNSNSDATTYNSSGLLTELNQIIEQNTLSDPLLSGDSGSTDDLFSLLSGASDTANNTQSTLDSLVAQLEGNSGSTASSSASGTTSSTAASGTTSSSASSSGSTASVESEWAQILAANPQAASQLTQASTDESLINSLL
ncbi:hypothetical protein GCM10010970_34210 [Silvimonas iriomotensis]|uniref:Uncharacterized protein n=1 Tax=Silvimonas iriomotensis TaxID=449662 RepID=A0ABQ2PDL7_9NEIS|nr:hypothetical protein GCM10010970_34210 [Silvimonas iriomotensis]